MGSQKQYIQDCNDVVYKVMPSHYLKLSPWDDGEDRRVMEKDINGYKDNIGNIHLLNGQDEFYVITNLINDNICITGFIDSFKQFNNLPYSQWQKYSQKFIKIIPVFELHILECPNEDEKQFYLDLLK